MPQLEYPAGVRKEFDRRCPPVAWLGGQGPVMRYFRGLVDHLRASACICG